MKLKANLHLNKPLRVGVCGWLEQLGIKLISTQVVVDVEVGVELGNKSYISLNYLIDKSRVLNFAFGTLESNTINV